MIRDTSQWLVRTFVDERRGAGWRRTVSDTDAPNPELSLVVYSVLGRAELPLPLPDNIKIAALRQLAALRFRPYHPAYHDIRQWVTVASRGKREDFSLPTEMLWYPWATEALVQWLRYADRHRFPPETRRALERSLGHVLVADSEDMVDDMSRAAVFSLAETAYGIAGVR